MQDMEEKNPTMFIFGARVDNVDRSLALNMVQAFASHLTLGLPARKVFFTNVHSIHVARRDREFMQILNRADLVLPDGSGLKLAGKVYGQPIIENLNGTDFTPRLLEHAARERWSVYLLGARPEVNATCRERLGRMLPGLNIVGGYHGHFTAADEQKVIDDINAQAPNILLVALGTPLQEKWIARNAAKLNVGVCLAVGGLFDFLSGDKTRAPRWMRQAGIEWLYRFFQDPKTKWYRVFVEIPAFLALLAVKQFIPARMRSIFQRRLVKA